MSGEPKKLARVAASMRTCRQGIMQPTLQLLPEAGRSLRQTQGMLHILAAEVELLSEGEGWLVHVESNEQQVVYLELLHGSKVEAERGLKVLRQVKG